MENLNPPKGRVYNFDLIRAVAIVGVILLHATGQWIISSQELTALSPLGITTWAVADIYQTLGVLGVPLFLMVTGALLLQPGKEKESLKVFFKKRWARIGLPFFFWAAIYFVWNFVVIGIPFSFGAILQGLLNGPYTQFWYIYVLFGLYLLTPLLRALLANADRTLVRYFIALWVVGVAILPIFGLIGPYLLNPNVFVIGGFVGYFVLGIFLTSVNMRRSTIGLLMLLGISLTTIGTYVLAATGSTDMYFFQEYISPTVILTSVMLFLLLLTLKSPSPQQEFGLSKRDKLIKAISDNTLGIYFLHVIVLESIQNGYFGFALNRTTLNPIIEVPLMTVIVLFVSLGIVILLKKVPYLDKLIG
jgi:surface polysaccharide O-acyltransferase-like enzyme